MNYGLIGEHLDHSYSKLIQERLLNHYQYDLHPIKKEDLDSFMQKKFFKGINVTIPYKQTVIPYLDWLDPTAQKIGAVNTVVNRDGKLYGYNTDYDGFLYMIRAHQITINKKKILVLGNGGAAQAIKAVVQDLGADSIIVTNRHPKQDSITMDEVLEKHTDCQIIINTTPCGMYPHVYESAVDISKFHHCEAVIDCIYNPLNTELILQAKKQNIPIAISGLEMLVAQAKRALELFKDIQIDDQQIDQIYREILKETINLLITDISESDAKEISEILHKKFISCTENTIDQFAIESNQVLWICNLKQLPSSIAFHTYTAQEKNIYSIISEFNAHIRSIGTKN